MHNNIRWLGILVGLSATTSWAETRWVPVGVGDCAGQDRSGSKGAAPDTRQCTPRTVGTAAVCWDGKRYRHHRFGHATCTYKTIQAKVCRGGKNPGRMFRCAVVDPKPARSTVWVRVGVGDCAGRDRGNTRGAAPDPLKCTPTTAGTAAVCWDGKAHRHAGFGHAECTYKTLPPKACKGGRNLGLMYRCVPKLAAPSWKRVGVGDCPGQDRGNSRGAAPSPAKCTARTIGTVSVCWDGKRHRHRKFGHAECTYKTVGQAACKGGRNVGVMYRCSR